MGMACGAGIATAIVFCGEEVFLPTDGRFTSPPLTVQAQLQELLFDKPIAVGQVLTGRDMVVQSHTLLRCSPSVP